MHRRPLKLSPQQLSLLIFRSNGLSDFEVERNLPWLSNIDNAIKFQREHYRTAVNLIILSLSRVKDYVSNSNLIYYFPNLYVMAYHIQQENKCLKPLRNRMIESDLYIYDKKPKWEILEAIIIAFIMNRLQSNEKFKYVYDGEKVNSERISIYYHRGCNYLKDYTEDSDSYFIDQIDNPRKNKLLKEQMNASIYELAKLDEYVYYLLQNSRNTKGSLSASTNKDLDYFLTISSEIKDSLDSGLIKKDQIANLRLRKNINNVDQTVNEIITAFSNQITSWWNNENLEKQGITWDESDFDWGESKDLVKDNIMQESRINSWVSVVSQVGLDTSLLYDQFSNEDAIEMLLKSKGKDCIELKLYKLLTVSHYMSIIIMESLIPGTLDGLRSYLECDYDGIKVVGVNIVDSFTDYLDNLVGYGREF
ncbi:hypothetical protein CT113_10680 [Levilactobacillus brevis]|uniref:hypothetical protein n=1 Tax=Levilactobacillus brevis TaxID=1580 RepID=UPI0003F860CB|nr:hypothetical protein [Levilactobacillus brevis]ARN93427.1 hypothetical protein AZI11_11260 [Levilactobacillus brevis]ARN96027.1 hypothetical protein AZI12_11295 [Levilactobacillus brevis]ATU70764.1 hypothetical protein CT113_10680 [Levilactobacillus brevis]